VTAPPRDCYEMKTLAELWEGNGPMSLGRQLRFERRRMLEYNAGRQRLLDQAVKSEAISSIGLAKFVDGLAEVRALLAAGRRPRLSPELVERIRAEFARLSKEQSDDSLGHHGPKARDRR